MLETVKRFIEKHQLLPASGELIVAVSGGADSLCLLHLLTQLCGEGRGYPGVRLRVAHLNHSLRGEASIRDAEAVARLATDWGIPATIGVIDVPALALKERRSLEDAARIARYRFLREVAQGGLIAVAHHADDQVETLLLHWLRGGGLGSMVGMQPRQQDIIRPLLAVTHAETVAYCQQHQFTPLEDASNTDTRFLRNRIRHELLPLLEEINPGIRATLLRNSEILRVDIEWIEAQVDAAWTDIVQEEQAQAITLSLSALLALPLSLQRHVLRRVTARLCGGQSPLELRHFLLIEDLLQRQHDRVERFLDLPGGLQVRCNMEKVVVYTGAMQASSPPILSSPAPTSISIPGSILVPGTNWIARAELLAEEIQAQVRAALIHEDWPEVWRILSPNRHMVYVDKDEIGSFVQVRTRQPGDRIRPLGMAYEKKVQDVLIDQHIPRSERTSIPLFFSEHHCIWLAGICLDDRVRLKHKTQTVVALSIQPVVEVSA